MITQQVLDQLDPTQRALAVQCIIGLYESGALQLQLRELKEGLISGDSQQEPYELAEDILRYRKNAQGLESMINLGIYHKKENEREQE